MIFLKESYQNFLDFLIEIESEINKINIIDDKINIKMSFKILKKPYFTYQKKFTVECIYELKLPNKRLEFKDDDILELHGIGFLHIKGEITCSK